MKNLIHIIFRVCLYVFIGLVIALFFAIAAVVLFEQPIPKTWLDRLTREISSEDYLVCADSASFQYSRGLRVHNLRVIDRGHNYGPTNEPACVVMSASLADIKLDLRRIPWSSATILRSITLTDFRYPRLPLGYYVPDSIEFPGQPDFREVDAPVQMDLPELSPFKVTLIRPQILGVVTPRVEVPFVEFTEDGFRAQGILLEWADADVSKPMMLHGEMMMSLDRQMVRGVVRGEARQHHIRPMLEAIDITNSFQFIDAFTKVEKPVEASCDFDVNLRNCDLHLFLDLHPKGGLHHGVPLKQVDGTIDLRVFVRDIYQNAHIVVGPIQGALADGSAVEGTVIYDTTNDVATVSFDVRTRAPIKDVLAIADVMNDGTLDCLEVTNCTPLVTLLGRVAVKDENAHLNDLVGTLKFDEGSFLGIPMRNADTKFVVKGTTVTFTNALAHGIQGGEVHGNAVIDVPESRRELANFTINLNGKDLPFAEMASVFDVDPQGRKGNVSGWAQLKGPLETNALHRLSGDGHLEMRNGHLIQMRIFAGLTEYLAKHVPGISGLVNLSDFSLDFEIGSGVIRASNVVVEGNIISLRAEGTYDMVADKLDFRVRVTLTKKDSFLATLATPITWPFASLAKVLLDFNVSGSLDNPSWAYNHNPLKLLRDGTSR